MNELHVSLEQLDHDIVQIDAMYTGFPRISASYLITKPVPVLIETGPKPSLPYIRAALRHLQLKPEDLRYLIVTHIHLDHCGGAGTLLRECPAATLVVHERGSRHLIDPAKLIAGTKQVYGEEFSRLFDSVEPVAPEHLHIPTDGEILHLGHGRTLTFLDTPGHSYHHLCIYDSLSQGIFCGDAVGLSYPGLADLGIPYYLPTSSPSQFNPEAMVQSLRKLASYNPRCLFFTHFGVAFGAGEILDRTCPLIDKWVEIATASYHVPGKWQDIAAALWRYIEQDLLGKGAPAGHPALAWVKETLDISAKGLAHYLDTKDKQ